MKFWYVAAIWLVFNVLGTAYGGGCDIKGHQFKAGEKYAPIGECLQYTCTMDGGITAINCAAQSAPPTCKHIPEDLTKPYPKCCDRYVC